MKMVVTLEITVDAENRDEAFGKVESLLGSAEYMLYDANAAEQTTPAGGAYCTCEIYSASESRRGSPCLFCGKPPRR